MIFSKLGILINFYVNFFSFQLCCDFFDYLDEILALQNSSLALHLKLN
jgi:hypothetical protein